MKIKIRILIGVFLIAFSLNIFGQNPFRVAVSLNGSWNFITDVKEAGISLGWNASLPQNAQQVRVPHTWNLMKGLEQYNGLAWYEKKFTVAADWKNKNIQLKFGAIYHDATIYLNGKKIKEHFNSGYTTFYADITTHVKFDVENTLIVSVNNKFSETNLPYKNVFDWVNDGGIIRDVDLIAGGKPAIRYVHIIPAINFTDTSAKATVKIRLREDEIKKTKFHINIKEKKSDKELYADDLVLTKVGNEFTTIIDFKKIRLWRFDDPFLYQIEVTTVGDRSISPFGFRKVELQGKKLMVNNEAVRLPGIEYMPASHPDYGSAEPKWVMDSVMSMFKELNAALTRFHWQVDEYILNLMDEKGILLQAEIPWWQQPAKLSPTLIETIKMQFEEMIERDFNHPSIFAWAISNEVIEGTDPSQYVELKSFVTKIDSSRLVNVVSNEIFKRKLNDESFIGDLPTWNEYIGTWFGKSADELPQYFNTIEGFLGNRPLLITENGLCEPRFAGGDLRRMEDMVYHYKEWAKRDYIAGSIYFCLNDYRTHKGEDGAGKFRSRIHGITDLYFKKKPSYYVFKQLASPIEIVNVKKLNDSKVSVILVNKNTLPSYALRNYSIQWTTTQGKTTSTMLPLMKPGDQQTIELRDMENRFAFQVISPTGSIVTSYPLIN